MGRVAKSDIGVAGATAGFGKFHFLKPIRRQPTCIRKAAPDEPTFNRFMKRLGALENG
ncbi:MAG: hypothetical protein OSB19_04535 [Opitutaceae bacterium]|jgi:hypothetical protein|nr:hypothetical protein [Opitutaceae bacterium]|tara:strand:- start:1315 stop:1488 length:174 start_codon:yes stop_codon:yes gene_type:complete